MPTVRGPRSNASRCGLITLVAILAAAAPPAAAREVAEIYIEPDAELVRAGDAVGVLVLLVDATGTPVDAAGVVLEALHGDVGPLERVSEGAHHAVLTVPQVLPRPRAVMLFARGGRRSAERLVPLEAGPAREVEIAGPAAVRVEAATGLLLSASVVDAFGNAADDEARAEGGAGPLPTRRVAPGLWMIEYRPTPVVDEGEDVVVVEAGPARGRRTLRLTRRARYLAAAPWVGLVLGAPSGLAVGASASARWRATPNELALLVDVGWWRLAERADVALGGRRAEFSGERTYVPLTVGFGGSRRVARRLSATLGAGGGAALVSSTVRVAGLPTVEETRWAPAFAAAGGVAWDLARGAAFLEARWTWVGGQDLSTLAGASRASLLVAGYRYDAR